MPDYIVNCLSEIRFLCSSFFSKKKRHIVVLHRKRHPMTQTVSVMETKHVIKS